MGTSPSKYEAPPSYPPFHPAYGQGFVPPMQPAFQPVSHSKSRKRSSQQWGPQAAYGYPYVNGYMMPNGYQPYPRAMSQPAPTVPAGSTTNAQPAQSAPFIPPAPAQPATTQPAPLFSTEVPLAGLPSPQAGPTSDAGRREQTPFPGSSGNRAEYGSQPEPQLQPQQQGQQRHRRRRSRTSNPDISQVLHPMTPASDGVFGPPGPRPQRPLDNPLPPPPRDLYNESPYKNLLNLPQTAALLTSSTGQPQRRKTGIFGGKPKGLLRALSLRKDREPEVHFVPVFVPDNRNGDNAAQSGPSSVPTAQLPPAPIPPYPSMSQPAPAGMSRGVPASVVPPVPPVPAVPPVRFNQESPLSGFMNHSPHRVMYQNKIYPSATHLHEAMKYLDHRPDIAESIRNCDSPADVYPLSAANQQYQRPDWPHVYMQMMEEVLYNKFRQHPDLRSLLMGTGVAPIVYEDPMDPFWGEGELGQGKNELGNALVHVRERLRAEGHR